MTFSIFERKRHFLAGAYGPRRNQPENDFWRIFSLAPHLFICSAGASFVRWRLICLLAPHFWCLICSFVRLAPHLFAGASFVRWRLISGASFVPSLI